MNKTDSRELRLNDHETGTLDCGIIININKTILDVAGEGEVEQNNPIAKAVASYSPRRKGEMHYDTPITNPSPKGSCQSIIHDSANSFYLDAKIYITLVVL